VGLELILPAAVVAIRSRRALPGYETDTINVTGRSPNMGDIRRAIYPPGASSRAKEDHRAAHVALIGSSVAEALFPDGRAVGKTLMMDGAEYTWWASTPKPRRILRREPGMDNALDIPLHTAESRYPQIDRFMITAKAKPGMREEAYQEVEA